MGAPLPSYAKGAIALKASVSKECAKVSALFLQCYLVLPGKAAEIVKAVRSRFVQVIKGGARFIFAYLFGGNCTYGIGI
jgi:hypothetical protein